MKRWHKFRYEFGFWWKNVWEKLIGMRLALWLDKRHPDWCWAELCVNLGLGWDLRNWREGAESIASCKADCARNGSCWCGKLVDKKKFAKSGVLVLLCGTMVGETASTKTSDYTITACTGCVVMPACDVGQYLQFWQPNLLVCVGGIPRLCFDVRGSLVCPELPKLPIPEALRRKS